MKRPSPLISYAQNHEDIVLARILKPWVRQGHWIDVGAGHPTLDSVTRLFSDFGWTGINVEPLEEEFSLLCEARPKDINLKCAIGKSSGVATLYEGPPESRGSSTLIRDVANSTQSGAKFLKETQVEVSTFLDVFKAAPWHVDFIKIDIEGMETELITSTDWAQVPVEIVVVEATLPNSVIQSHQSWEPTLQAAGYTFRLFDGLNRFYSRESSFSGAAETSKAEWFPATAQDNFVSYRQVLMEEQINEISRSIVLAREHRESAETYCRSLETELGTKNALYSELEKYARSLEDDRKSLRSGLALSEAERIRQRTQIEDLKLQLEAMKTRIQNPKD